MSRLTIDISDQQHKHLKALAALQGKTIKQYALERLFLDSPEDEEAWQELKTLLSDRIHEGLSGKVSTQTLRNILDEELAKGKQS